MLGAGQFCTNPGVVIALDGAGLDVFLANAGEALSTRAAQTMLTPGIQSACSSGVERLAGQQDVAVAARGLAQGGPTQARAMLFSTDAETFLANPALSDEIFGPVSVVVRCKDPATMLQIAAKLEGQLTATLHLDAEADRDLARALLPVLERKAGRVLANGFPTGVEVSHAMVHGGPFPATSDSRTTSVGTNAIERFLRPVCYQDLPAELLPEALQDGNPLGIWRLEDGELKKTR